MSSGGLDYLLIDLPPATGDAQLTLSQLVPLSGAITVTTPQEVALYDVRKGMNMFQSVLVECEVWTCQFPAHALCMMTPPLMLG